MTKSSIFTIIVVGLIVVAVILHQESKPGYLGTDCTVDVKKVSTQSGRSFAELRYTMCDGYGGSDVGEVLIHEDASDSVGSLVFKFNPSTFSGPVRISWTSEKVLDISADRVELIQQQATVSGPYHVEYHIGAVGPKRADEK